MTLAITDDGLSYMLESARAKFATDGLYCRLFQNNLTPSRANVLGDFTECTFDGYSELFIPSWPAVVLTAHVATTTPATLTWTKTAGATTNSVYGYYIVDASHSKVYWAERDSGAPYLMDATGRQYSVSLIMGLLNQVGVP